MSFEFENEQPRRRFVASWLSRLSAALALVCMLTLALAARDAQAQVGAVPGEWTSPTTIDSWLSPASVSCPTASFCMAVGPDRGGTAAIFENGSWGTPAAIGGAEEADSVSCASSSFCEAVGGKQAVTFDGSSWSTPSDITSAAWLRSVSCASASFCVAVDNEGDAITYNGSFWGNPVKIDSPERLVSVSCASPSFCMAVDSEGYAVRYDGTSWTAPVKASEWGFKHVSCASASLCIGSTAYYETAYIYDGSSWSRSRPEARVESVSCYSTSFCVGVGEGEAVTYNGSSWSGPTKINIRADSVACGSQSSCVAVAYDSKDAVSDQYGSWSAPVALGGRLDSVSCSPSTSCVAVDDNGRSLTYDGESWGAPQVVDGVVPLESVSCPTDSFCMAVDQYGRALSRVDGVWSGPVKVDGQATLSSVSCASSSFCSAVDRGGNAFVYENGSWGAAVKIDEGEGGQGWPLSSVSCPSTAFCVAVDEFGRTFTYLAGSWSRPDAADTWGLMSVSCYSEAFCAAVDWQGRALAGGGGAWGSPTHVAEELRSVSCPSESSCVAAGVGMGWLANVDHGYVSVFSGGAWSPAVSVDRESLTLISCASVAFCVALDSNGEVLNAGVSSGRPATPIAPSPPTAPGSSPAPGPAPPAGVGGGSPARARLGQVTLHGGTVSVALKCVGPSPAVCQVALELRGHSFSTESGPKSDRHRWITVGRTEVSLQGGQSKTARIRLNATSLHPQMEHRTASLQLVARQTVSDQAVVSSRVIKLPGLK